MYDAIERECPDAVFHLGDCYEDACDLRRSYPSLPVYAVLGNNDFPEYGAGVTRFVKEAIGGLRAGDGGDLSGWTYTVNGETVMTGAGELEVQEGDQILWSYVCTWE